MRLKTMLRIVCLLILSLSGSSPVHQNHLPCGLGYSDPYVGPVIFSGKVVVKDIRPYGHDEDAYLVLVETNELLVKLNVLFFPFRELTR